MLTFLRSINRALWAAGGGLLALFIVAAIFVAPTVVSFAQGSNPTYTSWLLYSYNGDVFKVNPADPTHPSNLTAELRNAFNNGTLRSATQPRWNTTGTYLSLTFVPGQFDPTSPYGDIWVMAQDGKLVSDLEACHQEAFDCGFGMVSPDGQWLVYTTLRLADNQQTLMITNLNSGRTGEVQVSNFDPTHLLDGWSDNSHFSMVGKFGGATDVLRTYDIVANTFADSAMPTVNNTAFAGCNAEAVVIQGTAPDAKMVIGRGASTLMSVDDALPALGNPWQNCLVANPAYVTPTPAPSATPIPPTATPHP